jgi:dolichol-phosphate mannosyltransferase
MNCPLRSTERRIDVVVPVYNEADGIVAFHRRLTAVLRSVPVECRIIYVNDGSLDATQAELRSLVDGEACVCVLELSRNFGHQAALTAGLDFADADAVIMLDGDGQHPPELIPEMLRLYDLGYDIVQTQRIDSRHSASRLKTYTARLFYALINRLGELSITPGAADFRLLSRRAATALHSLPEYHRFIRGMVSWLGFKTVVLPYQPGTRLAGQSKYSLRKMLRLARDGMFSFSLVPLRLGLILGAVFLALAVGEIGYVMTLFLSGRAHKLVPGWSSLIIITTLGSGAVMIVLGTLGMYVGMIFEEVKRRPIYVLRRERAPERERGE